jgi:hypothetical protein
VRPARRRGLGGADGELGDGLAILDMLVEPEAEGVADNAGDEGGALPGGEAFLGLAGKLGVEELDGEDVGAARPDVLGGQLDAPGQEVAELAEVPHRLGQAGAQAIDVGAALDRGDEVDVALGEGLAARGEPDQGPGGGLGGAFHIAGKGVGGEDLAVGQGLEQIVLEAVFVVPGCLFLAGLVAEADGQSGAEDGLGLEQMLEAAGGETRAVEIAVIGPEAQTGARLLAGDLADGLQVRDLVAVGEGHVVFLAVALDPDLQVPGEGVDDRDAYPVETTGEAIAVVGELAPGVELGEDDLDSGQALVGVEVHRHATAIVADLQGAIGVEDHGDGPGMAGQGLVDAVIYDFLGEVIGPGGVGVHARALADRVQAAQNLDGGGVVGACHAGFALLCEI